MHLTGANPCTQTLILTPPHSNQERSLSKVLSCSLSADRESFSLPSSSWQKGKCLHSGPWQQEAIKITCKSTGPLLEVGSFVDTYAVKKDRCSKVIIEVHKPLYVMSANMPFPLLYNHPLLWLLLVLLKLLKMELLYCKHDPEETLHCWKTCDLCEVHRIKGLCLCLFGWAPLITHCTIIQCSVCSLLPDST